MAGVWYTTREQVKRALDIAETARSDRQVDSAIEGASRSIDGHVPGSGFLRRRFYPEIRTQTFDWPDRTGSASWRLWLGPHELISATTVVAGGVTLSASDFFLRPDYGPPYTHVEINLGSSAAFGAGSTHQRAISITGVFGHSADEAPAGALNGAVSSTSSTSVDVIDSGVADVGTIIKAGTERMIVTGKSMMDTAVNIDAGDQLTASAADTAITCSTTTRMPAVGETILVDAERMLVVDVAGAVAVVKRAFDGSVLAAHAAGADIWAPRRLTVTRGALGTTAATHADATALVQHVVPGLVAELALAETLVRLGLRSAGYADAAGYEGSRRSVKGSTGLADLREQALQAYGRKMLGRAV